MGNCEGGMCSLLQNSEQWTIPMLVISAVNVLVIVCYEVFIVCRSTHVPPSRRHLFLSQVLLLGLLTGSCVGFAYGLEVTPTTCVVIRFGTGVSYVLIYSSLLVKLVFLISLNTGVYLPALYQALLLVFCVLVQIVVDVEWLTLVPNCQYDSLDHLFSIGYIIFLILFVCSLSIKSRNVKDNYREARYIGLLLSLNVPLWLIWIIAAVILPDLYHNLCFGYGLLSTCIITFIIMFLPKSRQLTAMGREGVFIQDLDEEVSDDRLQSPYHQIRQIKGKSSSGGGGGQTSKRGSINDGFNQNSSYLGFHRPLGVIPPSSTPPSYRYNPGPWTSQTQYQGYMFPSHFYPEKLYQYWHYYYPRMPGDNLRISTDVLPTLPTIYTRSRSKSRSPNPGQLSAYYPQNSFYYKY